MFISELYRIEELGLNAEQYKKLTTYLAENKVNNLFEIANKLKRDEYIFDGQFSYTLETMLFESKENLLNLLMPIIEANIPEGVLLHFNQTQAIDLYEKLLDLPIDKNKSIERQLNEFLSAGDISIPLQGLRQCPTTIEIIRRGVFAPILFKRVDLTNSTGDNYIPFRNYITDFNINNQNLIPYLIMKVKDEMESRDI